VVAPGGVDRHGDPLPPGAVARLGTARFRHGDDIREVAFTPDGKRVVSHAWGDGVRVWDAATGREVGSLPPAKMWPAAFALVKSGDAVVTSEPEDGTNNTSVRVFTFPGLKLTREFAVTSAQVQCISPDGKLVVGYGSNRGEGWIAEIWEVATGKRLHTWTTGQQEIRHQTFTPDGKHLVTGGDKSVRLWDVKTGKLAREIADHTKLVHHFAVSPDGATLATAWMTVKETSPTRTLYLTENVIRLWDLATGKQAHALKVDPGVGPMAFTPDGRSLVGVAGEGVVCFWDVASWKEQRRFSAGAWSKVFAFSPDGKTLAVCSGSVRLIDVATGKDKVDLAGVATVHAADVSPDGRAAVTLGDGVVALWDAATGRERGRVALGKDDISAVRFLGDGRSILGVGRDKNLRLWDAKALAETRRVPVKIGGAHWPLVALSPDRRSVATQGDKANTLILLDLPTGKERGRIVEADEAIAGAAFTPDGRSLVYWGEDHFAHVWDLKAGKKTLRFEFHEPPDKNPRPAPAGGKPRRRGWPYGACLSPDGRLIAYGCGFDICLALHEVATGTVVRVIDNLPLAPEVFAFTPDGRALAWNGRKNIHLTELASGQERYKLDGHKGHINSLKFAADGSTLVSSSRDGTGLVWDVFGRSDARSPLAPKELDACWADLAGDAGRAFQAMRKMLRSPDEAVPYLAKRVRPVPKPDAKRIAGWVADLDSDNFARRKAATAELEKLCELASAECRRALANSDSLEARKRLERLLAAVDADERAPSPERIRALRAVELLDRFGTPAARRSLAELSDGAPGARLTREAKASCDRAR
jgi:WD40 repeat protein